MSPALMFESRENSIDEFRRNLESRLNGDELSTRPKRLRRGESGNRELLAQDSMELSDGQKNNKGEQKKEDMGLAPIPLI